MCEAELKVGLPMWFLIFGAPPWNMPNRNLETPNLAPKPLNFSLLVEKFAMFRAAPVKFETTLMNQLSILFHKCGLGFYWRGAEDHGTP